jgi:hypothetical protein
MIEKICERGVSQFGDIRISVETLRDGVEKPDEEQLWEMAKRSLYGAGFSLYEEDKQ